MHWQLGDAARFHFNLQFQSLNSSSSKINSESTLKCLPHFDSHVIGQFSFRCSQVDNFEILTHRQFPRRTLICIFDQLHYCNGRRNLRTCRLSVQPNWNQLWIAKELKSPIEQSELSSTALTICATRRPIGSGSVVNLCKSHSSQRLRRPCQSFNH